MSTLGLYCRRSVQPCHCPRCRRFWRLDGYGGGTSEPRARGAPAGASLRLPLRRPQPVSPRCRISGALRRRLRDGRPHRRGVRSASRPRALAGASAALRVIVRVHRRITSTSPSRGKTNPPPPDESRTWSCIESFLEFRMVSLQLTLKARVGRNVDGMDLKLFDKVLQFRRKFEEEFRTN
jgi:hypothetical protein